ncbi:hypothetical protein OH77DRAFT_206954 [Trametes cingulata]|nr:hypothetical protein OH77DRAFT_206954 [Trametes cingulata]
MVGVKSAVLYSSDAHPLSTCHPQKAEMVQITRALCKCRLTSTRGNLHSASSRTFKKRLAILSLSQSRCLSVLLLQVLLPSSCLLLRPLCRFLGSDHGLDVLVLPRLLLLFRASGPSRQLPPMARTTPLVLPPSLVLARVLLEPDLATCLG